LKDYSAKSKNNNGMLVGMFDCELYGHWWFEGVWFIGRLVRNFANSEVEMITCKEYLDKFGMPEKTVQLTEGSWGQASGHFVWFNKDNTWTWEKIYEVEPKLEAIVTKHWKSPDPLMQRLLKQMCRENLIMQASDWQFLISTWSARDYAENRFSSHYENIKRFFELINKYAEKKKLETTDMNFLTQMEEVDDIFEEIDISAWVKDQWKEKFYKEK
jgi:1,4-alpha-glucan branching enzyme